MQFFDAFEGQSRREGPLGDEHDYDCAFGDELMKLLYADYFGELVPGDLSDNAHRTIISSCFNIQGKSKGSFLVPSSVCFRSKRLFSRCSVIETLFFIVFFL